MESTSILVLGLILMVHLERFVFR